jgi:signal transduction histidine kinase
VRDRFVHWATSLTAKYVAVFALLVTVPAIAVSAYLLDSSYNDNKSAIIRQQEGEATSLAAAVNLFFAQLQKELTIAASGSNATQHQIALNLEPFVGLGNSLSAFYIDKDGQETVVSPGGIVTRLPGIVRDRPVFQIARRRGVYFGPVGGTGTPEPTYDSGTYPMVVAIGRRGVVVGERISLGESYGGSTSETSGAATIVGVIKRTGLGRSGNRYAYAVDAKGKLAVDPVTAGPSDYATVAAQPQVKDALQSSARTGWTVGRSLDGHKVLTAFAEVPASGWRIFVEQPESEAFAPLSGKIWSAALLLAAFVAAGVVLSILLARRLVRPIKRMQVAAEAIGAGEYDQRVDLDRRDELGALAGALNRMAARLQGLITGLEQRVAERTRALEVASKHKSDFLANMSHELRTPLNAIVGFSQVLREKLFGEMNDKQSEYLDDILSSANHLLSLINDILDLSKVEAGQVELELGAFSLREALERGIVMVREKASTNGVVLALDLDPSVDLVYGDERRIRQVVFNLLSNAVKFTPEGGRVNVSTLREDGAVRVAVTDTGPGIPSADQERIFEEFQQARAADGERPEGTGLGLALTRSLVELHGGRIWVESEPGRGSTFAFTLPAEQQR